MSDDHHPPQSAGRDGGRRPDRRYDDIGPRHLVPNDSRHPPEPAGHVFVDCPQLHTNIGQPSAAPILDASGAYTRRYQNGLALVNPSSTATAVVTLPSGTWTDLHGTTVSGQLSMPPNTGSVRSN